MAFLELTAVFFGFLALIPTIASLTKFSPWWVRAFDFPRLQISFIIIIIIVFSIWIYSFNEFWHLVMVVFLFGSLIYQSIKIYPYTFFAKKEVVKSKEVYSSSSISILVSNVLAPNRKYDKLLKLVQKLRPDIVLTLESNQQWQQELEVLEDEYPYTVKVPQENLYGMHLYSKLELKDIEVRYLITDEVPSIHGKVCLRSGDLIKIHCLHPKPPSPSEDYSSTNRDAELLLVGKEVNGDHGPILVFGDLNDVAWSRTTRLFQRLSGLLDPRKGRGFYNTFHAGYPVFRWPLDHVFHTDNFSLIDIKRLENIGSDHFPIFAHLNFEPERQDDQEQLDDANKDQKKWAEDKIEDGNPQKGIHDKNL